MSRKIDYGEPWTAPSPEDVTAAIGAAGGVAAVCRMLKKGKTAVYMWRKGDAKIDYANWQILKKFLK